jgi:hypothetical protein
VVIKSKYLAPLLIAAAAAASIAIAPIAAAQPDPSPGYLDNGTGNVDAHSPGADPFVPLGTQIMQ